MKKIFIKYKQNLKKFLFSFPIFIACFSLIFSLPVSATTGTVYTISYQQPQATNYDGYIEVLLQNPENGTYQVYTYYWTIANLTHNAKEDIVFPRMSLSVTKKSISYSYGFQSNNSSDSFKYVLVTGFVRSTDGAYTHDYVGSSELPYINGSFWVADWLEIVGVKVYGNGYLVSTPTDDFNGGTWSVVYGGDNALYNQLESIKSILAQQSNQDIINNADKNAGNIQSNADKNASDIQANADKNTDKITNGGSDYGTVDKDTSDDYMSKEQELDAATSMSRENTVSLFSNFGSFFLNSKLAKGLTGTTAIMKEFFGISWLSDMANFGLILGAFAFVIGAGVLAGRIHRQKVASERRSSRGGK